MAFQYTGRVALIDEQGLVTTMTYDLGESPGLVQDAEMLEAKQNLDDIVAALTAITTANPSKVSLEVRDTALEDGSLPAEAEVPEEAAVAVHLAEEPMPVKTAIIRIPAPVDALFLADGKTVDTNNQDLQQYVAELGAHVEISDGEQIITARGSAGIHLGYLRFRSRSTRSS